MDNLIQDVKYSVRFLLKNRGFTFVAILTLTLGIGANAAIFSLVNAVLVRPLPIQDPGKVVEIFTNSSSGDPYSRTSYPDYVDLREQKNTFSGVIAYSNIFLNLSTGGEAERVNGSIVSGNYFSVLGVPPYLGRAFLADEDQTPGAKPVAVISYRFWQSRFGGDSAIAQKTVMLNGTTFNIVGVAPKGFKGTNLDYSADVWVPMMMQMQATASSDRLSRRASRWLMVMGRLQPNVQPEQAQAAMTIFAGQLNQTYAQSNRARTFTVRRASDVLIRPASRGKVVNFLLLLMAVAITVLIITCFNVANFMLARAAGRWKEMSIRLALGATRVRIVRQLLTESLLLALTGGVLGLLIASRSSDIFSLFNLEANQNLLISEVDVKLDYRVMGFTLLISLLCGVIFGLAPALQTSKTELMSSIKDETPIKSFHKARLTKALIVSQLSLSLVLLIAATLFVRSLLNLQAIDPGFKTNNALLLSIDVAPQGYDAARGRAFYRELMPRAAGVAGVDSTTLAKVVPVSPSRNRQSLILPENPKQLTDEYDYNIVAHNYFKTMGIPFLLGRDFTEQDTQTAPGVAIINEELAGLLWSDVNAIGKRFKLPGSDNRDVEVIGVVKNTKYFNLREDPVPYIYLPLLQEYDPAMTLVVSGTGSSASLLGGVRREIHQMDTNLPVFGVTTLSEHIGEVLSKDKMIASLVTAFGLLALLLVSLGTYGLMNHSVNQRLREMGIRMALGATARDVFLLVMKEAMQLAAIGIVIGLFGTFLLTRIMSTQFYEISPSDPITLVGASFILLVIAALATFLPAWKATRVEPVTALRYQ
ncbi:MAG TPA: ABC transporter permease [Pyrinomonadaceae bacterium]|nr:ABC transporter permease [Pyrinomonadaceae bacterium]